MKTIYHFCIALFAAFLYNCDGSNLEIEIPINVPPESEQVDLMGQINFNTALTYGTMTDQDGNGYRTITIGTQTWMAENLRTTRYGNGDIIPYFKTTSGSPPDGSYYNYGNDGKYVPVYGRYYNKAAVQDSRNLAPPGWRIPSWNDWKTLILYLDPKAIMQDSSQMFYQASAAADKLKEAGRMHWGWSNSGTNVSGFTALPGGQLAKNPDGSYNCCFSVSGNWWSSGGNCMTLLLLGSGMGFSPQTDIWASVRCIKIN